MSHVRYARSDNRNRMRTAPQFACAHVLDYTYLAPVSTIYHTCLKWISHVEEIKGHCCGNQCEISGCKKAPSRIDAIWLLDRSTRTSVHGKLHSLLSIWMKFDTATFRSQRPTVLKLFLLHFWKHSSILLVHIDLSVFSRAWQRCRHRVEVAASHQIRRR